MELVIEENIVKLIAYVVLIIFLTKYALSFALRLYESNKFEKKLLKALYEREGETNPRNGIEEDKE